MQLTPEHYIRTASRSAWHVADAVPEDLSQIRLVFVLESPHVEEIEARVPMVGKAGKSALHFLQGARWTGQSFGNFVVDKHTAGDGRLAIMNVSTVPLQRQAFAWINDLPNLTLQEWNWLGGTFRKSKATTVDATPVPKANIIGRILLDSLQERFERLDLTAGPVVVACGLFAQRYVRQLHGLSDVKLRVPHPANNQWHPQKNPVPKDLIRAHELFVEYTR